MSEVPGDPAYQAAPADRARAAFAAIAARALESNLARTGDLEAAVRAAREGRLDEAHRLTAQNAAHQLAGSAGTFGYPVASQLGHRLEAYFVDGSIGELPTLEQAEFCLRELRRALTRGPVDDNDEF